MSDYEHNSGKFGSINLEELSGVQDALAKLGYGVGKIDGIDGPNTQKAVRNFQTQASIKVDGIVGPETRQALLDELASKSEDEAPAIEAT